MTNLYEKSSELCRSLENRPEIIKAILDKLQISNVQKDGYFAITCPICETEGTGWQKGAGVRYANCQRGEGVFWSCYQDRKHTQRLHSSFVGLVRHHLDPRPSPMETITWIHNAVLTLCGDFNKPENETTPDIKKTHNVKCRQCGKYHEVPEDYEGDFMPCYECGYEMYVVPSAPF